MKGLEWGGTIVFLIDVTKIDTAVAKPIETDGESFASTCSLNPVLRRRD